MEGSSSAQSRQNHFNPFPLSSPGSSSSPIQNASTVTPQEGELPGKDTVATEGRSLLDFNKPQLGCTGSSSFSSTTQNDNGATNQQCDLLGKGLKRKRSSGSVVPNDNGRPVPRNNEEENHYAGISTELVLYEDKCKIKKKLKKSDLSDHLSRLMLSRGSVEAHVLPLMDEQMKERVKSKDGMKVVVRNADTREEHELVFRRWGPSGSYVLNCGWTKLFVKGRGLEVGDQIGMFWDTDDSKFHFTVHRKVACGPSNAVA
ncbi:putative B3 domain-containing protein At1g78640 [Eucalyptus grandis]|uniref:putative B3 domain-containing protein At1g78640 n=1 Tax=Eucalyptus grandis TaxID=71139 RepID=UPI00192EEFEA|nr:putative B3 domain-containing protein At1g78640 [Eucalyptus grandis]